MSDSPRRLRAILPLLKGRIVDRGPDYFKIAIGGSTTITVRPREPMSTYDLRDGDLLTLYTEVPFAQPSSTSV